MKHFFIPRMKSLLVVLLVACACASASVINDEGESANGKDQLNSVIFAFAIH